jgi:hypothetical protein
MGLSLAGSFVCYGALCTTPLLLPSAAAIPLLLPSAAAIPALTQPPAVISLWYNNKENSV